MRRYENPKTGEVIETEMEEDYAVDNLPSDSEFARSLKRKYIEDGPEYMSDAQIFWVMKLALQQEKFHKCETKEIFELLDKGPLTVKFKTLGINLKIYKDGGIVLNGGRIGRYTKEGVYCQQGIDPNVLENFILAFCKLGVKECMRRIGKRTGICCYCARELTHDISIGQGYGPVCADKFGLPFPHEEYQASLGK